MSDGLGLDCLHHYDDQHLQLRKDFFGICTYDKSKFNIKINSKGKIIRDEPDQECMAKILRIVETLTNTARKAWYATTINAKEKGLKTPPQEPKEYPIELAYGAMYRLMYETHSESIIRNSAAVLVQKGYILRRQETSNSIPVYVLNRKLVQEELKKLEEHNIENRLLNIHPNLKRPGRPRKQKSGVEFNSQASENNTRTPENNSQVLEFNTNNISDKKDDKKQTRSSSADIQEPEEIATTTADKNKISIDVRKRMQSLLTPIEQKWFEEVWCESDFIAEPALTANMAGHIQRLALRITSIERLNALHTYVGLQPFMKGKTIQPGNLTQYLNEFLLSEPIASTMPKKSATPGEITFRADTADYLREGARLRGRSEEEAMALAQKYYEQSTMSVDQFDSFIVSSIMSGRNWLHDLALAQEG